MCVDAKTCRTYTVEGGAEQKLLVSVIPWSHANTTNYSPKVFFRIAAQAQKPRIPGSMFPVTDFLDPAHTALI
jgi:hypothetical protein